MVDAIADINPDIDVSKLTVETLKNRFLSRSSWHHTSMHYNVTDFYSIKEDFVKNLSQSDVDKLAEDQVSTPKAKRDADLDQRVEEAYRKVLTLLEARMLTTETGAIKRLVSGKGFEDGYRKAVELIRQRDASRVDQWRKLPSDHYRQKHVALYDTDIEAYINELYANKKLSKNSNAFKTIAQHLAKEDLTGSGDAVYSERDDLDNKQKSGYNRNVNTNNTDGGINYAGQGKEASDTGRTREIREVQPRLQRKIAEILRKQTSKRSPKRSDGGRGRIESKESRELFESRVRRDGYRYVESYSGNTAIAFKPASESDITDNSKVARDLLEKWGFEVVVFIGDISDNKNGVTESKSEGFTLRDRGITTLFISANLNVDGVETAYHEALHATKYGNRNKYRNQIINIIENHVDVDSPYFEIFVADIANLYSYIEKAVYQEDFEREIIEEFYSWYVGQAFSSDNGASQANEDGNLYDYLKNFSDVESAKKQIEAVYNKMGEDTLLSERDVDVISNRELLANALESVVQNDIERAKLAQYKADLANIEQQCRKAPTPHQDSAHGKRA